MSDNRSTSLFSGIAPKWEIIECCPCHTENMFAFHDFADFLLIFILDEFAYIRLLRNFSLIESEMLK